MFEPHWCNLKSLQEGLMHPLSEQLANRVKLQIELAHSVYERMPNFRRDCERERERGGEGERERENLCYFAKLQSAGRSNPTVRQLLRHRLCFHRHHHHLGRCADIQFLFQAFFCHTHSHSLLLTQLYTLSLTVIHTLTHTVTHTLSLTQS